jgi:hypothetical protein
MWRLFQLVILLCWTAFAGGCAPLQTGTVPQNPFPAAGHPEAVWEQAVQAVHDFGFEIRRENRFDGLIETEYQVGSGVLEPWKRDAIGLENRLEGSLQSIRRQAFVHVTPADGGYLVGVEVFKELEDLPGLAANSPGGATFQEATPLQRDLNLVVGQTAPSGWIPQGRDLAAEQAMLQRLHAVLCP